MIQEKLLMMVSGFAISIFTARHLGPDGMGVIQYCLSVGMILVPLAQFGGNNLVFDRSGAKPESGKRLINQSDQLRSLVFISLSTLAIIAHVVTGFEHNSVLIMMLISCYFTAKDLYISYFNSTLNSKVNAKAAAIGTIISQALRMALTLITHYLPLFCLPYIVNTFIPYWIKRKKLGTYDSSERKRVINRYSLYLISNGTPLAISSFFIVLYEKINSIVLAQYLSMEMVGLFNAAYLLASVWLFFPLSIVTSVLADAFKIRNKSVRKINKIRIAYLSIWITCIPLGLIFYFFPEEILFYTFGKDFIAASGLLLVLYFSTVLSVVGTVSNRIIVNNGGYRYLMYKNILIGLLSIPIAFVLIKNYQLTGAAYSILTIQFLSSTLLNFWYKKESILSLQISSFSARGYASK
ncbi:hypothetical protein NL53_17710 [Vibrio variabilis]|uniref:Polysaccharide biosynthesis protein n=2 Tax=Vibrio variabilis TaxID=990271 RepID=A0ABR4Y6S5_9VIBR|nr:hypothetical protein NL53_17710 [Vibrio variabilis]